MVAQALSFFLHKNCTNIARLFHGKLAHAVKNIDKIIECYDGGYSGRSYARDRDGRDGRSYRGSYAQRRDAMGRYSREDYSMAMAEDLRDMMKDAPDQQTRQDIQRIVSRLEQM